MLNDLLLSKPDGEDLTDVYNGKSLDVAQFHLVGKWVGMYDNNIVTDECASRDVARYMLLEYVSRL